MNIVVPAGVRIYYTTDGSTPNASSTLYDEVFYLRETTTVKAIAIKDGISSTVTTRVFTKGTVDNDEPGGDDH